MPIAALAGSTISHPSCFVSKKVYDIYGGYDTRYAYVADYDFMLRMKREATVEFLPVYEVIANYRLGGASASGDAYMDLVTRKLCRCLC